MLLYNGVLLGVVGGLAIGAGNGAAFLELVAGARRARAVVHRRRRRGRAAPGLGARRARTAARAAEALRARGAADGGARRSARRRGSSSPASSRASCTPPGSASRRLGDRRRRSASLYWALVVWRGRPAQSRARAFARRYALTQAAARRRRRLDTRRPRAQTRGDAARGRRARRARRPRGRRRRPRRARSLDERLEVGVGGAGHGDRVAPGEHRQRLEQRPRRRSLEQVGEDEHERPLARRRRCGRRSS